MLEKEYEYYNKNKDKFIKEYLNKYIVIKGDNVLGVYNSKADAAKTTLSEYQLGTFMIKLVKKDDTARFFNKVFLN